MSSPASSRHDDVHSTMIETEDMSDESSQDTKLKAQLQKLQDWRIEQKQITFPQGEDACEFVGGHATVTKALMEDCIEYMCPNDIEEKVDEENGDEEKQEKGAQRQDVHNINSISSGWIHIENLVTAVAVKRQKTGDNKDLKKLQRLALKEVELLHGLDHRHVICIYGFVEDAAQKTIWLIFPWCDNGTLSNFVTSENWEVPERICLIFDVSQGVEYLHTRDPPICHGDLKSMNILVDWRYRAVITDFGSARRITNQGESEAGRTDDRRQLHTEATFCALTNTVTLTGNNFTVRWAAPEQLLSEGPASLHCDIWALGWIAYEVVTNSIPFGHITKDFIVIQNVLQGDLPAVVDDPRFTVIRNLCSLMTRCWKSEPTERPTASECRQWMSWMPMIIPSPRSGSSSDGSERRSPELLNRLGTLYGNDYDFPRALSAFTEALRIYTQLGNKVGRADVLRGVADLHYVRGEGDLAIEHYQEALDMWTELGFEGGRASALRGLGDVHRSRNALDTAITYYSEALQIYTKSRLLSGRAGVLSALGVVHRLRNEVDSAVAQYSEALEIYTKLGYTLGRAITLQGLGDAHLRRNELDQADSRLSEALDIYIEVGDRVGRANTSSSLGQLHRTRNQFKQALPHYSKALEIFTSLGNKNAQVTALYNLAAAHRGCSDFDQEVLHLSEALNIYTKLGDKLSRANALYDLGGAYRRRNELDQALPQLSEALDIYTELGDKRCRANTLYDLGDLHHLRNDFDQAISQLLEALATYTDLEDKGGRASTLRLLGQTHHRRNELEKALSYFTEALGSYIELERKGAQALMHEHIAVVHRLRNETDLALQQCSAALGIYTELGNHFKRWSMLLKLVGMHRDRGELDLVVHRLSETLEIFTKVGSHEQRARVLLDLGDVQRDRKELDQAVLQYSEALDIYTKLGNTEGRWTALRSLAKAHHLLGENREVIRQYSEILTILDEPSDKDSRGPILAALARTHQSHGEYGQAIASYTETLKISLESGNNDLRVDALRGLPEVLRLVHPNSQATTVPFEVAGPLRCSRHGEISGPCVVRMQIRLTDGEAGADFCQCVADRAQSVEAKAAVVTDSAKKPTLEINPPQREPTPEQEAAPSTSSEVAQ